MDLITIKEIVERIKSISLRHKMVNDFGWGPTYNIGTERPMLFPYIWVENLSSRLQSGQNGLRTYTATFNIYCMGKADGGNTNLDDTTSDTNYILTTLLLAITNMKEFRNLGISITTDINSQPLVDATDDSCNGWSATVEIKVPVKLNTCDLPIDNIENDI
jgi:hypothetical protein